MSDLKEVQFDPSISPEGIARLKKEMGDAFEMIFSTSMMSGKTVEPLPKDTNGLMYQYYPILIKIGEEKELVSKAKVVIRPCINTFRGCDKTKAVIYTEEELKTMTIRNAIEAGCHPGSYDLGITPRFFDPKKFDDIIEELKNRKGYRFMGFMHAMDGLELTIGKIQWTFGIGGGCYTRDLREEGLNLQAILTPIEGEKGMVFNWNIVIQVAKE